MNEFLDFTKPIDDALVELADQEREAMALAGLAPPTIDDRRLLEPGYPNFRDIPCCIYFYYVRLNSNGRVFVTHHFYPGGDPNDEHNPPAGTNWPAIARDPAQLTPILEMLAHDARPLGTNTYKTGEGFENIVWRRKAYIAFFIDETSWTVTPREGVQFVTQPKNGVPGTPNHSFFDALYLPLTMRISNPRPGGPTTDQRSAMVCINHMKADDAGNDLTANDPAQLYHFLMAFDVAIENSQSGAKMTVIFDPDGNNMGPPISPP
jgi:hypothetical protein